VKVPFVDLRAQHESIKDEVESAMLRVARECAFVGGKYVQKFEDEFSAFCGCDHAVGMSSGTSALQLALIGMGVQPGDEVITAANTFIATVEAIGHTGATVKLVDADPVSYTIDPLKIEEAITERTKVIIPVHLYGQAADMDPIMEIARRRGLMVLEDAAQAQGAEYKGRIAGSIGDAAAFSFYPAKNLGAYGDAGAIVTCNEDIAERARLYSNHGRAAYTDHAVEGFNERLDGIQAAVLSAKLPHLRTWNDLRRAAAERYDSLLGDLDVVTPAAMPYARHIYHLYVIRVKDRSRVMEGLKAREVGCGLHYRTPIHLLDAYKHLGIAEGTFPVAEGLAPEILSLPMFPTITEDQQKYVAQCLEEILEKVA
jgi:dTDP-4-amino-4,6-dideoxygalactose transaminase